MMAMLASNTIHTTFCALSCAPIWRRHFHFRLRWNMRRSFHFYLAHHEPMITFSNNHTHWSASLSYNGTFSALFNSCCDIVMRLYAQHLLHHQMWIKRDRDWETYRRKEMGRLTKNTRSHFAKFDLWVCFWRKKCHRLETFHTHRCEAYARRKKRVFIWR